jgi:hypothetical protein
MLQSVSRKNRGVWKNGFKTIPLAFFQEFGISYFPICRDSIWTPNRFSGNKQFLNFFNNFITAVDRLPRYFDRCQGDPFSCLSLPLLDIISTSLHSHSFNVNQLLQEHPGVR